jgi:adenine specific DNA methylase Mod
MIRLGVESHFKPILWFVKEHRGDTQTFVRDVVTGERQKDVHDWQQHIKDAEYYIEKLVSKNGTVVDFCVGSGTTLVAAKKLGRQWIGFEIDKETAKAASQRLESVGDAEAGFLVHNKWDSDDLGSDWYRRVAALNRQADKLQPLFKWAA